MPKIKIENVIATADLQKTLDLENIAKIMNARYNPEDFPAVMYKMDSPKASFLIFQEGKIVCSGTKTIEDCEFAIDKLLSTMKEPKHLTRVKIKIQNIVAISDLEMTLDLNFLKDKLLMGKTELSTEYPFLIYNLKTPKVSALLFSSGKIVINDAKEEKDVNKAVMKIEEEIKQIIERTTVEKSFPSFSTN